MNRTLPEISESAAELAMLMRKEKKGRMRDRIRVLWLLKTGQAHNRGCGETHGSKTRDCGETDSDL